VETQGILPHEAIMNLPQNATDFLDVFIGLHNRYKKHADHEKHAFFVPRIHVYAFTTHLEDPIGDIINRSAGIMRCSSEDIRSGGYCEGHVVRDVSPKKVMVCLSFKLPMIVADAEPLTEFPAFGASACSNKKRSAEEMTKSEDDEDEA
jgi:tRNA (guanine37-N1)-methyltransferase